VEARANFGDTFIFYRKVIAWFVGVSRLMKLGRTDGQKQMSQFGEI
jgi:hypothetical protein